MASSATPVELGITAGLPYSRRFRVHDGTNIWPTLDDFEVRSHVRAGKTSLTPLLTDLTPFLVPTLDGTDIVVDLKLTGAETRTLLKGFFDIVISDKGDVDARALPIASGRVKIGSLVTAASDG